MEAKITIFSTPTCPYCNMAKDFLKENGISYTDFNVKEDANARKEMLAKSGQLGVPVIIVKKEAKETIIIGFDREKIESVLEI
jgi:glutaredoxin-like YruB-family protein